MAAYFRVIDHIDMVITGYSNTVLTYIEHVKKTDWQTFLLVDKTKTDVPVFWNSNSTPYTSNFMLKSLEYEGEKIWNCLDRETTNIAKIKQAWRNNVRTLNTAYCVFTKLFSYALYQFIILPSCNFLWSCFTILSDVVPFRLIVFNDTTTSWAKLSM